MQNHNDVFKGIYEKSFQYFLFHTSDWTFFKCTKLIRHMEIWIEKYIFFSRDQLGKYTVCLCTPPTIGLRSLYSRRWPSFLGTPCETPLSVTMQPSEWQWTPWLRSLFLRNHPWNIVCDCLFSFVSVFSSNPRYRAPCKILEVRVYMVCSMANRTGSGLHVSDLHEILRIDRLT